MLGLILTAGGARGAYQAGVLKRMGEIPSLSQRPSPFPILTGASAGAINCTHLAAHSENFLYATQLLSQLWSNLEVKNVFKTDPFSLASGAGGWVKDLALGGMIGGGHAQSLLDFSPLRKHLSHHFSVHGIADGIEAGRLYAVAVSATNYYSGKSFTFIQGSKGHPIWEKSRRVAMSVELNIDHIWASCSIPIIFQPVLVKTDLGEFYFGDGGLRLVTPLSPAIRLGATRLFAIGIRSQVASETRLDGELMDRKEILKPKMKRPPLAQIFGIALNSIFLDHLDTDLDHLRRMNDLLTSAGFGKEGFTKTKEPMHVLDALSINPSVDLATIAETYADKMPRMVGYLMEGLGSSKAQSADLMSYLLFDPSYTNALIDVGYQDASKKIKEIENFLVTPA